MGLPLLRCEIGRDIAPGAWAVGCRGAGLGIHKPETTSGCWHPFCPRWESRLAVPPASLPPLHTLLGAKARDHPGGGTKPHPGGGRAGGPLSLGQASPVAVGPLVQLERGLRAGWRPGSSFHVDPRTEWGFLCSPLGCRGHLCSPEPSGVAVSPFRQQLHPGQRSAPPRLPHRLLLRRLLRADRLRPHRGDAAEVQLPLPLRGRHQRGRPAARREGAGQQGGVPGRGLLLQEGW